MTIEAVIFDLDNTLLNRREAFKVYADHFISKFIVISSEEDKNKVIDYMIEADMDGYRKKKELYHELLTNLEMKSKDTTLDKLLEFWFSEFPKCSIPMNGAIHILEYFRKKNIYLGLITNGSIRSQNAKIDHVNIRHFFDSIIISDEVGIKKPDKRIFEIALKKLKVTADKALFVGDQPLNDIKGSADAGLKAIWLRGFSEWNISEKQPRYSIKHLTDLKEVFDRINA